MIRFVSISSFRRRLTALLKVKRGVYACVKDEICLAFKDSSIEQIRHNRDMILINNDAVVVKLRIPDRKQKLSKADGYRLIYMVMKQIPLVVLLDIYPNSQQLDIEDNETNRLMKEFVSEADTGSLVIHNINDQLKEVTL